MDTIYIIVVGVWCFYYFLFFLLFYVCVCDVCVCVCEEEERNIHHIIEIGMALVIVVDVVKGAIKLAQGVRMVVAAFKGCNIKILYHSLMIDRRIKNSAGRSKVDAYLLDL